MNSRKIESFSRSLRNLEGSQSYEPPFDAVTEAGLVALFQAAMEQSWKAIREVLEQQGFSEAQTGSPRKVIKCAYSAGMIDDEEGWLSALEARNLIAHSYDESVALRIIDLTREKFIPLFVKLEQTLQNDWID